MVTPPVKVAHPPSQAPARCECGCGGQPKTKGARFIRGHFPPRTHWTESVCLTCRQPFGHWDCYRRLYCSDACQATARRSHFEPEIPLAVFLFDQWRNSGLSLRRFASTLKISRSTLVRLLHNGLPNEETYERLKAIYGARLPACVTATERRRQAARLIIATNRPAPGTAAFREARRKAGEKMRGRHNTPDHIAKTIATKKTTGVLERSNAALLAVARSRRGRIMRSLGGHLRHIRHPTRKEIRRWAQNPAAQWGIANADVVAVWQPYLEAHGLWSKAGRKANEERHELVDQLIGAAVRTAAGRLPRGFWEGAAAEVSKREGEYISGPELRVWYDQHRHRYCSAAIT